MCVSLAKLASCNGHSLASKSKRGPSVSRVGFRILSVLEVCAMEGKNLTLCKREDQHHLCATAAARFGIDSSPQGLDDGTNQSETETRVP